ncbi:Voltage-gated Ion Channel (VIC) Superfamily [Thraustotheca clavata]|uniref:Voltage-gated Ion Channel (VIC) Superfamily n=1 Tax=Thraustotheca clavata TaxID=74557 RepID=A0A1V9YVB4_9STRA|nr:Voltage-gated Ion Channel (VIC) Superfamily [Thraustotheca clavata]
MPAEPTRSVPGISQVAHAAVSLSRQTGGESPGKESSIMSSRLRGKLDSNEKRATKDNNRVADMLEQELNGMSADQIAKMVQRKRHGFVISMNSKWKRWWDVLMAVITVYVVIVTPVQVAFELKDNAFLDDVQLFVDTMFILEIIITFRTSYVDSATREEINDVKLIQKHYLYGWFLADATSSYPISYFPSQGPSVQPIKFLRILKIFRVFHLSKSPLFASITAYVSRKMNPAVLRMLKLGLIFILSQHLMACSYYWLVAYEGINEHTWEPPFHFNDSLSDRYVGAFYFAIMVTTANDLAPETTIERIFTSVMLLIGIGINASIIGSAANLLANLDKTEVARKEHLDSINDYLRFKKVPLALQDKIRHYYDYVWTVRPSDKQNQLFVDLPDRLKLQLTLSLHRDFINKVPLFKALSPGGAIAIVQCMESVVAMPQDLIIREGELGDEFYFINSGFVEIDIEVKSSRVQLGVLGAGSYFGEIALLTNEPRSANVRATLFCELEMIRKDDFNAILNSFPQFHIALKKIADSRQQTTINMQKMSKLMKSDGTPASPSTTSGPTVTPHSAFSVDAVMNFFHRSGSKTNPKVADAEEAKKKPNALFFDTILGDDFILNMSQAKARHITKMKRISADMFARKSDDTRNVAL